MVSRFCRYSTGPPSCSFTAAAAATASGRAARHAAPAKAMSMALFRNACSTGIRPFRTMMRGVSNRLMSSAPRTRMSESFGVRYTRLPSP